MKHVIWVFAFTGCMLSEVTPQQRATAYEHEAKAASAACKAYAFDRRMGLVPEVPAMTELCTGK